jgi:predicted transcriptional regulator of viral defense system
VRRLEVLTIKERGIRELYKRLKHNEVYSYRDIKSILMAAGASSQYANLIIEELQWHGVLERVRRGYYRIDRYELAKVYRLK